MTVAAVCIVFTACVLCKSFSVSAQDQNEQNHYKYYKSVQIKSGDTLWSIAKEYKTGSYESTADYVKEIMSINGLSSDNIQDSQYLTVVYYDKDFK